MNAIELRIGNYVSYGTLRVKIEAISSDIVSVSGARLNRFTPIEISKIDPISLSEKDVDLSVFGKNFYSVNVKIDTKEDMMWVYSQYHRDYISYKLPRYVHQIQNLLFALTGIELKLK